MTTATTRLAPSPTGALHLGNARTFLVNWALAKQRGWRVILRIEDIDHPRVKPDTIDTTRDELHWLGVHWDEEVALQSTQLKSCHDALNTLGHKGMIYPCDRTRAELAASAPNEGDQQVIARASDRPACAGDIVASPERDRTWRLCVPPGLVHVHDECTGNHHIDVAADCGDFAVWTRRNVPAYQLAVAVDDARQGVTDVVRGDDLLPSAARQQLVLECLGLPVPRWWHLPLLRGPDGRRLAKRHGDSRIARWCAGRSPERLIAFLARISGLPDAPDTMTASQFAEAFDVARLPKEDVIITEAHLAWLDEH